VTGLDRLQRLAERCVKPVQQLLPLLHIIHC
jgi:hypothetical protein